jgi:hypothetical protein
VTAGGTQMPRRRPFADMRPPLESGTRRVA